MFPVNFEIGTIYLGELKKIDKFLQIINKYSGEFSLKHDNFEVNAKSILGILSLDLENVLQLKAVKMPFFENRLPTLISELKSSELMDTINELPYSVD